MAQENLTGRQGGAVSLAVGMSYVFHKIKVLDSLIPYFYHFMILFEALFILTAIDAGTSAGRFLLDNLLVKSRTIKETQNQSILNVVILGTFLFSIIGLGGVFALYGATFYNMAAFGFCQSDACFHNFSSRYCLYHTAKEMRYAWITTIPWIFVTVTNIEASIESIFENYLPNGKYLLAGMNVSIFDIAVSFDCYR